MQKEVIIAKGTKHEETVCYEEIIQNSDGSWTLVGIKPCSSKKILTGVEEDKNTEQ